VRTSNAIQIESNMCSPYGESPISTSNNPTFVGHPLDLGSAPITGAALVGLINPQLIGLARVSISQPRKEVTIGRKVQLGEGYIYLSWTVRESVTE